MGRPKINGLTPHELEIMSILWRKSPLTVSEILEAWPHNPKPAYTSLLTAVSSMERKKYIEHSKQGKAYYYSPLLKKNEYKHGQIKRLIGGLFDGSAYDLAVNLIKREKLTNEEISNLRKMLEEL